VRIQIMADVQLGWVNVHSGHSQPTRKQYRVTWEEERAVLIERLGRTRDHPIWWPGKVEYTSNTPNGRPKRYPVAEEVLKQARLERGAAENPA
jgi:hypothetical protein